MRVLVRIVDATWPELRRAVEAGGRTAIVPLGATEQHGPHLVCGTDTIRAAALAARLAEAWEEPTLVAPPLPVGASDEHGGFPGLVGVSSDTLRAVLVDVATRLSWWGVTRVVFLSTHGGNHDALAGARATLAASLPWLRVDVPRGLDVDLPGDEVAPAARGLHAGEAETSEMLALRRTAVRKDALAAGLVEPPSRTLARLRASPVHTIAPNGVVGDPRGADAHRGARRLDALVAALIDALDTTHPA